MFRLISLFISLILFILFDNKRFKVLFNSGYYNYNDKNRTGLSDFIRLTLRRKNAIKQSKRYYKKEKELYKLKNDYVLLIYDYKKKTIKCIDKSIKKRIATVDWYQQTSDELYYIDNIFEETFDNICALFNERSTYDGVKNIFQTEFTVNEIDNEGENKIENVNIPQKNANLLNINSASEKELTDLPGISIIHAKNIIKYRTKNCGFKSLEEFYSALKINSHFQKQLRYYLFVGTYVPQNTIKTSNKTEKSLQEYSDLLILDDSEYNKNNERIIDL